MSVIPPDFEPGRVAALLNELNTGKPVTVSLAPVDALALAALIQLAVKHPRVDQRSAAAKAGVGFVVRVTAQLGPVCQDIIAAGWNS